MRPSILLSPFKALPAPIQDPRNFTAAGKLKTKYRNLTRLAGVLIITAAPSWQKLLRNNYQRKQLALDSYVQNCIKLPSLSKGSAVKHRDVLSACVSTWEETSHWPHIALMPARDQHGNTPTTTKTKGLSSYLSSLNNMKNSPTF